MTDDRTSATQAAPGKPAADDFTLTVYVAAPGTPIRQQDGALNPSLPGHAYYSISDGRLDQGFGFSPIEHGKARGPGQVVRNEFQMYLEPLYARTMEISRDQYEKLLEYGTRGTRGDPSLFDLRYNGATNSCVDFVWKGLEHAGIHRSPSLPLPGKLGYGDPKGYDGELKPTRNIEEFERLQAPLPDSPHNKTERKPMPDDRTLPQRLLSDEGSPRIPDSVDQGLLDRLRNGVRGLDQQVNKQWNTDSDRVLASAYALSVGMGFSGQDDVRVLVNEATRTRSAGELLMVARVGAGASPDPYANRADMPMSEALSMPETARYEQAHGFQQARQQASELERQQAQAQAGPVLS